jgi:tetratricopeptide (TPR) repeat protein
MRVKSGLAITLAVLTLLVYAPVRDHQFLNWDDNEYVVDNPQVSSGLTWAGLRWAMTTFHAANWHPLTWISHMADYELFGADAGRHHLSSLLLHTLNVLLLFGWLWRLSGAVFCSFMTAALFALHPLHVESVAWVAERKDLLSGFFTLLTLTAYTAWIKTRPWSRYYWSAVFCFAAALAAKPMAVTVPFVLLLLDYWPLGRPLTDPAGAGWRLRLKPCIDLFVEKWPFFLLTAASCAVTLIAQRAGAAMAGLEAVPPLLRLQNAAVAYAAYIVKTIWPFGLSPIYPLVLPLPLALTLGALVLLAAISWWAWRYRRLGFAPMGWLWYLGMLVPTIGIVQVGSQSMADRYTYLPSIGFIIMLTWGVAHCGRRLTISSRIGVLAGILLLAGFGLQTYRQAPIWRDSETLFNHAVMVDPHNYLAHSVLGDTYRSQGRLDKALFHYEAALYINPDDTQVLTDLGVMAMADGRWDETLTYLQRALAINPEFHPARFNLGDLYMRTGRFEQALEQFQLAIRSIPGDARAHTNIGVAFGHLGNWKEAENAHRRAVDIAPNFADSWNNLGYTLANTGRLDEAIAAYGAAVRLRPTFVEAIVNWSQALLQKGDVPAAQAALTQSLRELPQSAELHYTLANLLAGQNRLEAAIDHYSQALRITPRHALAGNNLAHALNRAGRTAEAMEQYRRTLEIDPRLAMAHNNLGLLLLQGGQTAEARDHFRTALDIDPDYVSAHFNLGLLHALRGELPAALARFETALRLEPDFAAARYKLGETHLTLGDPASARREVERLRSLDPALADRLAAQLH